MNRQDSLGLKTAQTVVIIGVGGVGSWAGLALGKAGIASLHLYDSDLVEETNLHRTPYGLEHVGMSKPAALCNLIPSVSVRCFPHWNHAARLPDSRVWVLCCVDSHTLRVKVYEWTRLYPNARYLDCAAEGEQATLSDSPALVAPQTRGYEIIPQWIGPQIFAGLVAADIVLHDKKIPDCVRADFLNPELFHVRA